MSVSKRFVAEIEEIEDVSKEDDDSLIKSISEFMAYVHKTVGHASHLYLMNDRRFVGGLFWFYFSILDEFS